MGRNVLVSSYNDLIAFPYSFIVDVSVCKNSFKLS